MPSGIGLVLSRSVSGEETVNYSWDKSAAISVESDSSRYNVDTNIWVPRLTSQSISRNGQTYTTSYGSHDSYGNPGTISESGNTSRTTSRSYWYNTSKNIVHNKPSSETVSGGFSGSYTTSYGYNGNGNVTQINKYGVVTNYGYYGNGNLQSETNANQRTMSYGWNYGVISSISTPHYTISRSINSNGTVAGETDGRGNWTYFSYDGNLRLTQISPPGVNPTNFSYPSDNSSKTATRGSFATTYSYDGFGRPTGFSNSKGVSTSLAYKACGPKNYSDSNIGDQVYYDNFNRATQAFHKDGQSISYSYSGSNVTMTNETGGSATYTYYAFGDPDEKFLVSVTDPLGATASYGRNMPGSLTSISYGGMTRSFRYE